MTRYVSRWTDNLAAKIRATPPWLLFAWLAISAVSYAYLGRLILLIFAVTLIVRLWWWASMRYDFMIWVNLLIAAMCGRRRRW